MMEADIDEINNFELISKTERRGLKAKIAVLEAERDHLREQCNHNAELARDEQKRRQDAEQIAGERLTALRIAAALLADHCISSEIINRAIEELEKP